VRLTIELSIEDSISLTSTADLAPTILINLFNAKVPLNDFGSEPAGLIRTTLSTNFRFLRANSNTMWPPKEEPIKKGRFIFNFLMNLIRKIYVEINSIINLGFITQPKAGKIQSNYSVSS